MIKNKIKKGDTVKVIAGKDKGKTGKVMQVFAEMNRVVVDGVNKSKRHLKPRRSDEKGQTVEFFMPINASNVMLLDESGKQIRHNKRVKL